MGIIAFVDSVIELIAESGDRQNVSKSISANTGIALARIIEVAEAVNEKGEQIISSPGPMSIAIIAVVNPDVDEFTAIE